MPIYFGRRSRARLFFWEAARGWKSEVDESGILAIHSGSENTTSAFIFTGRLIQTITPGEALIEFGRAIKKILVEDGGDFNHDKPVESGERAEAGLTAIVENIPVKGMFFVDVEKDFITLKGYWAPVQEFSKEEMTLKQILSCFKRKTALSDTDLKESTKSAKELEKAFAGGTPWGELVSKQDGDFTFMVPQEWTSKVDSSAGDSPVVSIALDPPTQDASVAFLYNLNRYGVTDSAQFANVVLALNFGIQATLDKHETINDGGRNIDVYDFAGNFQGKSVRGIISIQVQPFLTFYAHYAGIQMALTEKWDLYAPTLNAIQGTIRFSDASGALANLPSLPRYTSESIFGASPSQIAKAKRRDSNPLDKWADAMRGYEEVESPTTGQRYDAPLNAWNPTGPEGAGYYRKLPGEGGLEKLIPVNK